MNTLAHVAGSLALLWLAVEMFTTFDEAILGIAVFGVFLLSLIFIGMHVFVDLRQKSRRNEDM